MSSKRRINRELRQKACGEKKKYGMKIEAVRALYRLKKRGAMHPYKCEFCRCWHIGHASHHAKTVDILKSAFQKAAS